MVQQFASRHDLATDRVTLAGIWNSKYKILLGGLIGAVAAAAVVKCVPSGFEATARLWVDVHDVGDTGERSQGERQREKEFVPTQAEIVRSPIVVQSAVKRLMNVAVDGDSLSQAATSVAERLSVDPLIGTRVLKLIFRDTERQRAVDTTAAVIAAYREFIQQAEVTKCRDVELALGRQQTSIQARLVELNRELTELRSSLGEMTQREFSHGLRESRLSELAEQLSAAEARRIKLEQLAANGTKTDRVVALVNRHRMLRSETAPVRLVSWEEQDRQVGSGTDFSQLLVELETEIQAEVDAITGLVSDEQIGLEDPSPLRRALLEVTLREVELRQRYGDKHPDLIAVTQQATDLEQRLLQIIEKAPAALGRALIATRQYEASLREHFSHELALNNADQNDVSQLTALQQRERELLGEMQRLNVEGNDLAARLDQLDLAENAIKEGRAGIVVTTLEAPTVAESGLRAPLPLSLGLAGMLGSLVAGLVFVERGPCGVDDRSLAS